MALAIAQYLEQQVGRKNVFIDVDMHAGAKFSDAIEGFIKKSRVMLVLIGPSWLNASRSEEHTSELQSH